MNASGAAVVVSLRRRAMISRGWRAGLAVGIFSALLFTFASNRLQSHGYVVPAIQQLWNSSGLQAQIGGQWMTQLLIALCKLIPGSTVRTLSVTTILGASLVQGFIAHDLVKRGWPSLLAALAVGLTGLHPVMLYLATSGSPFLIFAIAASCIIIALDRLEAIGDTQSLIVMGLTVALLFLIWPNAIFFVMPLTLLLPPAFRQGRNITSIVAMFIIVAAPSLIAVSAVIIGGALFELSWPELAANWSSPLHGGGLQLITQSPWLTAYGSHPAAAFLRLFLICLLILPRNWVIAVRLLTQQTERCRPATGLAALFLPTAAGALATWFWQISSPWTVVATSLLCSSAWVVTASFRRWERWFWTLAIFCGVLTAWITPLLWSTPDLEQWRRIILSPLTFP
ncbi:MAG: hypothetical protein PHU07_01640 [Acidocella sp.]|nr:hypothetical protein [Acidocella sp.]